MNKTIINIENVSKVYKNGTVGIKNLNLNINNGEFIAIIGPSGAGKSTLLKSINLLIKPTQGKILFQGKDIVNLKEKELRKIRGKIGMIFQNYNLIAPITVIENVLHGALNRMTLVEGVFGKYKYEDKELALSLLQEMGLEEKATQRADELSGGQQQRVGICRALAQKPNLILADEPIASLDPRTSEVVMNSLRDSCLKRNISCLVNLHQVDIAKKYATRIIGMRKGEIIFDGTPDELTDGILESIYYIEKEVFSDVQLQENPIPQFV